MGIKKWWNNMKEKEVRRRIPHLEKMKEANAFMRNVAQKVLDQRKENIPVEHDRRKQDEWKTA